MPLTHLSLKVGKSAAYRAALQDGVYQALRETFDVPEGDRFMTVCEHAPSDFAFGPDYLSVARSENLVMVQITANNTRSVAQKKALYLSIAERLKRNPGLRSEDILINLIEVAPENWSLGHGLAQYAK